MSAAICSYCSKEIERGTLCQCSKGHTPPHSGYIHQLQYTGEERVNGLTEDDFLTEDDTKASDRQVGGDHYKTLAIEPGEYATANGLSYMEGNCLKYITRDKDNKRQDIRKAIHCLELELEWMDTYAKED